MKTFLRAVMLMLAALYLILLFMSGQSFGMVGQDVLKPKDTDQPTQAVAILRLERQVLMLQSLATQIRTLQVQFDQGNSQIQTLIDQLFKEYGLSKEVWVFDLNTMAFTKKPVVPTSPQTPPRPETSESEQGKGLQPK